MRHRVRLTVLLLALGSASGAQATIATQPWLSALGFSIACVAVVLCGRDKLAARTREPRVNTPEVPAECWLLFGLGVVLCAASGLMVAARALPLITHGLWGAGLLALAAAAVCSNRDRERPTRPWSEVLCLALLILGCVFLFGWDLSTVPLDVHGDDAEIGLDALRLLETTPFNLFRTSWFRLPIFHAAPTALGLEIFGRDLLGLRATSAVIGTITVVLTFGLARRLWNLEVAIVSAIVLATGRYFIHLSRAGYHYVDTPCVSVAVLLLFLAAWRERRLSAAIGCGVVLGLGVQTYYASRLIAPLLVVIWLLWLWRSDPALRRARLVMLLAMGISAMATAAPMIGFFSDHWVDLWRRSIDTSIFNPGAIAHLAEGYPGASLARVILIQLQQAVLLFNLTPDTSLQYGYRRALLDPVSAVFFVLGFIGVCAALRTRRAQLLLLWIIVPVVAGGALTIDAPFYPRISGALPFVAITIALGIARLLNAIRAVLLDVPDRPDASLADGTHAGPQRTLAAGLTIAITLALLAAVTSNNLRSYFFDYAGMNRYGPAVDIARWIHDTGAGRTTYLIGAAPEFSIRHGTIRFINHGTTLRDVTNLDEFLATERLDPKTSRFVVMPRAQSSIRRLQEKIGPLHVDPHRQGHAVQFYTAVPASQIGTATPAPHPAPVTASDAKPSQRTQGAVVQAPPRWLAVAFVLGCIGSLSALAWLARGTFITTPFGERSHFRPATRNRWWSTLSVDAAVGSERDPSRAITVALIAVIMLIGIGLRVYYLDQLPAGFYCDEAGLGYNAWAILQTGHDETGARLPLFIWSFDTSYKNPVWLYSATVPIALLGLNEYAVRITSALYGSATILALFFLGRALLGTWGGLIAAAVLAVVPWHLHFSRIAFELITFPFFFVWGATCFVRSVQGRRLFPLAALLFGYALYTYAIAKLFVPLFLVGCALLFWRELLPRWREIVIAVGVLTLTAIPLVGFDLQNRERAGHYFADTSVFAAPQAPAQLVRRIARQYASFFSPQFLFISGDRVVRHAVQGHGELYYLYAPLLLLGIIAAWRTPARAPRLLLWWLAVYPVAPSLMTEAPTASRGIIGVPVFCLLVAGGAIAAWRALPRTIADARAARAIQWLFAVGVLGLSVMHVRAYWQLYSEEYPLYAAKYYTGFQYGHREVIDYFRAHQDEYDLMVLTAHRSNQAHIFPLFYTEFPPQLFAEDPESALRRTVKMQVGWLKEMERFEQYDRILFAVTEDELDDVADYEERARIIAPDGTAAFVIIDVSPGRSFIRSWIVGGPYPMDDDSLPPASAPDDLLPELIPGSGWRIVHSDESEVDLNNEFSPDMDEACAWAINAVNSPIERTINVRAGFDDIGQVWINGERLELEMQSRPDAPLVDPHIGQGHLRAGRNIVAVRSCEILGDWFFYLNFTETDGKPVQGLEWEIASQTQ